VRRRLGGAVLEEVVHDPGDELLPLGVVAERAADDLAHPGECVVSGAGMTGMATCTGALGRSIRLDLGIDGETS
jgi:hypothetical protein